MKPASQTNQMLRSALSRRTFLVATGVGTASLILPGCGDDGGSAPDARPPSPQPPDGRPAPDAGPDRYAGLDSDAYLGALEVVATVESGALDAPVMGTDGRIYFTNAPASEILVYDPEDGTVSVFHQGDGANAAGGMILAPDGRLIVCEGGVVGGAPIGPPRLSAIDADRSIEFLVDEYMGQGFQPPADVAVDAQGRIYFTVHPVGPADTPDSSPGTVALFRSDLDGTLTRLLGWPDIERPAGVVTSPDDSKLYLLEAHAGAGKKRQLLAYDLDAAGNVSNPQVVYDFYPGRGGDGMAMDAQGNLYVAAGLHTLRNTSETLAIKPGIHVISPQGQLLAFRETPVDLVTSCRFGGADLQTLHVTAGNQLLRVPTVIAGKAGYRVTPA